MHENIRNGEYAQLRFAMRALELDYTISIPTIPARYDYVLDDGTKLSRIQVKYCNSQASHSVGAVHLKLIKRGHRNCPTVYTKTDIDALVVYLPATDKLHMLPVKLFDGRQAITIRYQAPKNSQTKKIILAEDYIW